MGVEHNRTPDTPDPRGRYRAWLRRCYLLLALIWVVLAVVEHTRSGPAFETWGAYAFALVWFVLWLWARRGDRRDDRSDGGRGDAPAGSGGA